MLNIYSVLCQIKSLSSWKPLIYIYIINWYIIIQKKSKPLLFGVLDFTLPIYWDNMSQSDPLKVIDLDQSSTEYKTVKRNFKTTVKKTVLKVWHLTPS